MADIIDWEIEPGGNPIVPGRSYSLWNRSAEKYVAYGKRRWGINLKWYDQSPSNLTITRRGQSDAPIKFGETIALREKKGGYVCYKKRRWGINLGWSSQPVYEWVIGGGKRGNIVGGGKLDQTFISLYNIRAKCYVAYGKRDWGINLVWESCTEVRDHR